MDSFTAEKAAKEKELSGMGVEVVKLQTANRLMAQNSKQVEDDATAAIARATAAFKDLEAQRAMQASRSLGLS
jgi:hypothetical protein